MYIWDAGFFVQIWYEGSGVMQAFSYRYGTRVAAGCMLFRTDMVRG